jgi:hypothetical protein
MNKDAFFKYVETRGQNAYGSAILVKEQTDDKYSLLIASETVPAVFGSQGSFEFNLVNSKTIGKIPDKMTLDDKEVEFLLHRDNIYRLESLKDKVLDFLYFTPDFMGWHFTGMISNRPNDATAEILRGTYTITPISADPTPIMDARSLVMETIVITDVVPDSIVVPTGNAGTSIPIVCDVEGFTISTVIKDGATGNTSTKFTATAGTTANNKSSVTIKEGTSGATSKDYAIAYITVSATGMASWTTTVALQGSGASAT